MRAKTFRKSFEKVIWTVNIQFKFTKYFAVSRKNLNAMQDLVTGSCETFFYHFPPQKIHSIFLESVF